MEYDKISDNELVLLSQKGDTEAITEVLNRYKGTVKVLARSMFLIGGDTDDLVQEGTLGILKAVETYNGKSSFSSYVYLCIKSKILSMIKQNNRKKNIPLNTYVSIYGDNGEIDSKDVFLSMCSDPEQDYINKEAVEELKISIRDILSKYEYKILTLYLSGKSTFDICEEVGKEQKSIDNALHRIRRKIEKITKR